MNNQYRVFCEKHDSHGAHYTNGRPMMNDLCPLCELADCFKALRAVDRASGELNHLLRRVSQLLPPSDTNEHL